jgi:hypothetical protein
MSDEASWKSDSTLIQQLIVCTELTGLSKDSWRRMDAEGSSKNCAVTKRRSHYVGV